MLKDWIMLSSGYILTIHLVLFIIICYLACKQALRMGFSEICFRKARGQVREGEPVMVLVRFEYLRSDSERKLLIG